MNITPIEEIMNFVIVCGGRDYTNRTRLIKVLDDLFEARDVLVSGGAEGADRLGEEWAWSRERPFIVVPARWKEHGKKAGPIRNKQMLLMWRPRLVIAFPGGKGTGNMVKQAKEFFLPPEIFLA